MEKRHGMRGELHRRRPPTRQTFWITTLPNAKLPSRTLSFFSKHIFGLLIGKPGENWECLLSGVLEDAANFTFQTLRPSALSHDLQPCNGLLHASDSGGGKKIAVRRKECCLKSCCAKKLCKTDVWRTSRHVWICSFFFLLLSGKLRGDESEGEDPQWIAIKAKKKKVSELSYLRKPVRADGGPSSLHSLQSLIQAKKQWRRWRLAPSCHCFHPARWQRGQPAPRRSSSPIRTPRAAPPRWQRGGRGESGGGGGSVNVFWKSSGQTAVRLNLEPLNSRHPPPSFPPSSPSSLHTVLLSSLYCGWGCWAAAFKPGASVTGSRGRVSGERLWSRRGN